MTYKEITDLIKNISKSNLSEFKYKNSDVEITIRTDNYNKSSAPIQQAIMPVSTAAPVQHIVSTPASVEAPAAPAKAEAAAKEKPAETADNYIEVKSPIVGTFYRAASPEKPPYVKVGDTINTGDVVCIVEAMKLFNEIESEVSGKIVKVMIDDAQPVEYDQVLYLVDPNA